MVVSIVRKIENRRGAMANKRNQKDEQATQLNSDRISSNAGMVSERLGTVALITILKQGTCFSTIG